jgi:hypothetical protein
VSVGGAARALDVTTVARTVGYAVASRPLSRTAPDAVVVNASAAPRAAAMAARLMT